MLRYPTGPAGEAVDGLPGREGAFLACSFWLADNYALVGRTEDARRLFRRLLELRNDVGLLAEEYDPAARRQLGNFPQAFSHVPLVNTAMHLSEAALTHATCASRTRARIRRGDHEGDNGATRAGWISVPGQWVLVDGYLTGRLAEQVRWRW